MKRLLKPVWNLTRPVRAKLAAKLDRLVYAAADRAVAAHDPPPALLAILKTHFEKAEQQSDEITLVLDAVIAEQFRLQSQVEDLRRRLDEAHAAGAGAGGGEDAGWR